MAIITIFVPKMTTEMPIIRREFNLGKNGPIEFCRKITNFLNVQFWEIIIILIIRKLTILKFCSDIMIDI